MNPKMVAEVYILHVIDQLDDKTAKQFMSKLSDLNASYSSIDQFMQEYEAEESVYVDLIEWLQGEWKTAQASTPKASAKQFAKDKVADFLASLE